jgi:hypothetical protein
MSANGLKTNNCGQFPEMSRDFLQITWLFERPGYLNVAIGTSLRRNGWNWDGAPRKEFLNRPRRVIRISFRE